MLDSSHNLSSGRHAPPRPGGVNSLGPHPTRGATCRALARAQNELRPSFQRLVAWVVLALVGAAAEACGRDAPPRAPVPEPMPAPAPAGPGRAAAVDASVTALRVEAPDASTGAEATAPKPARFGAAPSTTPGKILCGDAECALGSEVCCEDERSARAECVAKPAGDREACGAIEGAVEKHCDEKADCPGAETCCMTWACSGGCPPIARCSDAPCLHGPVEQCLPGGACSAGFVCVPGEGSRPGACVLEKPGVACGKQRCSGDAPICCWNEKKRAGSCARACADDRGEDVWALVCTSPRDCGGYPCANFVPVPAPFATCMGAYDVPDRSTVVFCERLADCPTMNLMGKPIACAPDPKFPGKAQTCRYASP